MSVGGGEAEAFAPNSQEAEPHSGRARNLG